jgi:hypothetical protein
MSGVCRAAPVSAGIDDVRTSPRARSRALTAPRSAVSSHPPLQVLAMAGLLPRGSRLYQRERRAPAVALASPSPTQDARSCSPHGGDAGQLAFQERSHPSAGPGWCRPVGSQRWSPPADAVAGSRFRDERVVVAHAPDHVAAVACDVGVHRLGREDARIGRQVRFEKPPMHLRFDRQLDHCASVESGGDLGMALRGSSSRPNPLHPSPDRMNLRWQHLQEHRVRAIIQ